MPPIAITFAALALLAGSVAAAKPADAKIAYSWSNVKVGGGGYAPAILFNPARRGEAYLRTDMGGVYRFDPRSQRWQPLQDPSPISSYMGIESIALDPTNPGVVAVAAGMYDNEPSAILRSTDGGNHWTTTRVPFRMGGNAPGRGLGERLTIDPNAPKRMMFGSRNDGLWRSDDSGAHWSKVTSFPMPGLGTPSSKTAHGGLSFVLADPASGQATSGSRRWWVGRADPGGAHLFLSEDGGAHWRAVATPPTLLAAKAAIARDGTLYVGFASDIGPNGVRGGAVWRYERDGVATDITPPDHHDGGYFGVALSAADPAMVAVSTINRTQPGDAVWVSHDRGGHWDNLRERSHRDVSATPFLLHEGEHADFGHWISGLAIDQFDPSHIANSTGATVYSTKLSAGELTWRPWVEGIEQTAVITLASPTGGAPLVSGFGDIGGFVHDDLYRSPQPTFIDPYMSNTNRIDYAGQAPQRLVRSGSLYPERARDASLGVSSDGGRHWTPLRLPALRQPNGPPAREDLNGDTPPAIGADGRTILVSASIPQRSTDDGRTWSQVTGVSSGAQLFADKVDPRRFYALDTVAGRLLESRDGGASFASVPGQILPGSFNLLREYRDRESSPALVASPFAAGDLYLQIDHQLFHSSDGGRRFVFASGQLKLDLFGLGKGDPLHARRPILFATGTLAGVIGVFRSDDDGAHWQRINDDQHQWGLRFRAISGDPRSVGRVYLATDGRGIFVGEPGVMSP